MKIGTYEFMDDLLYSEDHEWVKIEGDIATVGIDDYSQREREEIAYVELPQKNKEVNQFEVLCELESVKAVVDCYMPVSGDVIEINERLESEVELVNSDPHGEGWMIKIQVNDPSEASVLMDSNAYEKYLSESEG